MKTRFAPGAAKGLTKKEKEHRRKWAADLLRSYNMAERPIPFERFEVTGLGVIRIRKVTICHA